MIEEREIVAAQRTVAPFLITTLLNRRGPFLTLELQGDLQCFMPTPDAGCALSRAYPLRQRATVTLAMVTVLPDSLRAC